MERNLVYSFSTPAYPDDILYVNVVTRYGYLLHKYRPDGSLGSSWHSWLKNGNIQLVINTPLGAQSRYDEYQIGRASIRYKITVITTISGAQAAVRGIRNIKNGSIEYRSLQEVFC